MSVRKEARLSRISMVPSNFSRYREFPDLRRSSWTTQNGRRATIGVSRPRTRCHFLLDFLSLRINERNTLHSLCQISKCMFAIKTQQHTLETFYRYPRMTSQISQSRRHDQRYRQPRDPSHFRHTGSFQKSATDCWRALGR